MTRNEAQAYFNELYEIAKGSPGPNAPNMLRVATIQKLFTDATEPSPHMKRAVVKAADLLSSWLSDRRLDDLAEVKQARAAIMEPLLIVRADIETDWIKPHTR